MSKTTIIATGIILSVFVMPSLGHLAFAEYLPSSDGQPNLYDLQELAQKRVKIAQENPGTGSGTPMFAAEGIFGATVLSAGIFGGIAAAFFVKSRKGKYAEIGRG